MLRLSKTTLSAIFSHAKRQDYFEGENPVRDTVIDPTAPEPEETYAYSLAEELAMLSAFPEPAATVVAVAAFEGLGEAEMQGLEWPDYRDDELYVNRNRWNGHVTLPKTRKRRAPIPVIPQVRERLEMHRLRSTAVRSAASRRMNTRRKTTSSRGTSRCPRGTGGMHSVAGWEATCTTSGLTMRRFSGFCVTLICPRRSGAT